MKGQLERELLAASPRYAPVRQCSAAGQVLLAVDKVAGEQRAVSFLERTQIYSLSFSEQHVLDGLKLHHPHCLRLTEVLLTDDHLVLVQDHAPGGTLADAIPSGGLREEQARWLFVQVAFALEYAHRMGVTTVDLQPETVLVSDADAPRPLVKLACFGLPTGHSRSQGSLRMPPNLAPETILNVQNTVANAKYRDVWSLGVLLYTILTGSCPFRRTDSDKLSRKGQRMALLQRTMMLDYKMPDWLSQDCKDLIARMLVAEPTKRPSMQEVLQHPWCCFEMPAATILQFNEEYVAASAASQPSPEVVAEVGRIFLEARMDCDSIWALEMGEEDDDFFNASVGSSVEDSTCHFDLLACEW